MKLSKTVKCAAALALGLTTASAAHAQGMKPEDAIAARRAVMHVIMLNFGPIGAMAKGDIPFDAQVARDNAGRMAAVSTMPVLSYFVEDTDKETLPGGSTKALPEIWLDWDNFKNKLEKMRKDVAALAEAAGSGDEAALKKQVGETGKGCKSCHDDFRSK